MQDQQISILLNVGYYDGYVVPATQQTEAGEF